MATIFVDYENVFEVDGLRGAEYLNAGDKLFIFYSDVCGKVRNGDFERIKNAKCDFKIQKLVHSGKNALDFYIATKLGMEYQKGDRQIVIVSRDKGFSAIQDYLNTIPSTVDRRIIRSKNIEDGLLKLTDVGNEHRRKAIAEKNGYKDLAEAHAYIQAKAELRDEIEKVLHGTKFEAESSKIISFIDSESRPSKRAIYSNSLHEYGLQEGLELYRILKEVV
ncbi:PIN domain-containing protein [Butyrivibrio proteoclasticus]|uniref:PIN domain-containing protein n=1 Tax=Butyrivibrio proteoclasticus TaxID=43305 RepID=UPI00047C16C6|nr:PIN domain-containing protein [Butyrivibrio proteoclasticus]